MWEGVLNCILDYLQLYQKRRRKKALLWLVHSTWETQVYSQLSCKNLAFPGDYHSYCALASTCKTVAIILILHCFCISLLCLGRRVIISHRFSTPTPLGNTLQFAGTWGGRPLTHVFGHCQPCGSSLWGNGTCQLCSTATTSSAFHFFFAFSLSGTVTKVPLKKYFKKCFHF